jgi:predicted enzyme related to lactoylglutathione lyase
MTTFSQLRVLTDDFPASFRFYRDVLGLLPKDEADESGPYGCFEVDGGTDIALFARALMAGALGLDAASSSAHLDAVVVLRVDDVDAAFAEAVVKGGAAVAEPTDQPAWGMRVAHLRAPEGTIVEYCAY